MATKETWSSIARHDSDANYQAWRDEFITKLGVLVTAATLAADETNITPGAGARPGTNTEQGYAVFHLADSLHGTAPVYIRFGFGTAASANRPQITVTVGTSTNGSGVIGGTAKTSAISICGLNGSITDSNTARNSYFCALAGYLGLSWKQGYAGEGFLGICRTCDATGAPTATGAVVVWGDSSASQIKQSQCLRFAATAAAYTARTAAAESALGMNPQAVLSSAVGSDIQVFLGWMITPQVAPIFGLCGVLPAELPAATTFSVTLVGSTPRTYISVASLGGSFNGIGQASTGGLANAMLWE